MSYLVLARKFRPQTFSSIIGQEHITRALANAILLERVPHAFLFTGPRGVGKTTSARVLARALNCTGRELPKSATRNSEDPRAIVEPCGECTNCREIAKSVSLSVWEIDGASNNSVDNVRELIDSLRSLPPPGSRYKIYIIDEVHMLSTAAFNALLKSLEEPPPNTVFIFATTEPHKIPDTVISRCQRHDFRRLPVDTIVASLRELIESEKLQADDNVLEFVALKAQGGMRDAQSMLDRLITFSTGVLDLKTAEQLSGVVDSLFFFELSEAVFSAQTLRCLELLDKAFSQSLDVRQFAADFLTHWRNLLLMSAAQESKGRDIQFIQKVLEVPKRDIERLAAQAKNTQLFQVQRLFDIAEETTQKALVSNFPRFVFEAGVSKMAVLPTLRPLADIVKDIRGGFESKPASREAPTSGMPASDFSAEPPPYASQEEPPTFSRTSDEMPFEDSSVPAAPYLAPEAEEDRPFDGSWERFTAFVKGVRSEPVLAAFLRRVAPQTFVAGKLTLVAGEFDTKTLKDPETLTLLKSCLESYGGSSSWEIRFVEAGTAVASAAAPSGRKVTESAPPRRTAAPVSGSLAMVEKINEKQRLSQLDSEAREDPSVQAALSMFQGSSIERVNITKK